MLPLTSYHDYLAERGLSEETCEELGIGFLGQGRSPLRGRVIFQLRDAREKTKKSTRKETAIISHIGRATDDSCPKYLYYEGFQKSAELLGQDRCWLHQPTIEQIKETGFILVTEGPFDWAKCIEAGLLNVVATMGAQLSQEQAKRLKTISHHHKIDHTVLAFDRDKAGCDGTNEATKLMNPLGLDVQTFDWSASLGQHKGEPVLVPKAIADLADFSVDQLCWLRKHKWL